MVRLILAFLIVLEFLLTNPRVPLALEHVSETCLDQQRSSDITTPRSFSVLVQANGKPPRW